MGDAQPLTFRRHVVPIDASTVGRLATDTGFFRPDEIAVAVELVKERLNRGEASGYHFVFAEAGGEVVGYTCYGHIGCTLGSYDLYWIIVDHSRQRQGIGRRLLEETERLIAEAGGRRIYIEPSNRPDYVATREF